MFYFYPKGCFITIYLIHNLVNLFLNKYTEVTNITQDSLTQFLIFGCSWQQDGIGPCGNTGQAENHATLWASKSKNKWVCEKLLSKKIIFTLKIKTILSKLLFHEHTDTNTQIYRYTHTRYKYRYTIKQYVIYTIWTITLEYK